MWPNPEHAFEGGVLFWLERVFDFKQLDFAERIGGVGKELGHVKTVRADFRLRQDLFDRIGNKSTDELSIYWLVPWALILLFS